MTRGSSASRRQKALVVAAFVAGSAVRTLAPRRPRCLSRGVLATHYSGGPRNATHDDIPAPRQSGKTTLAQHVLPAIATSLLIDTDVVMQRKVGMGYYSSYEYGHY